MGPAIAIILLLFPFAAIFIILKKNKSLKTLRSEFAKFQTDASIKTDALTEKIAEFTEKYSSIIDKDEELKKRQEELNSQQNQLIELNNKYQNALKIFEGLEHENKLYSDDLEISEFGLYKRQFDYETSEKYKVAIELNYDKQKALIKYDNAVICHKEWTVGGSITEGKKMTNQYKKLMLFAFNGECDSLISKVKWNNAAKTKERILKSYENINKLGARQYIDITKPFLDLKLEEFSLTYEYEQKKYEEKEEQRRIREQMKDEEKAVKEFERAQKEAEDEEKRFQKALEKAHKELNGASLADTAALNEKIQLLEVQLKDAQAKKERAISMAQLTRVGHIYVISNLGSFGENVYKIGMTRRLDPLDRVKELGDASVPFHFDVHAIIYSEDAPQLEYKLHQNFADKRLNRINHRKEFFKVTLEEIEGFIKDQANAEIEFTKLAEAREYRETVSMLEQLAKLKENQEVESKHPASLI